MHLQNMQYTATVGAYSVLEEYIVQISGCEDLRVQKTVTAIRETFSEMILRTDYDKITVTDLCKCAKINKKTFYRYYETLDALLEELLEELTQGFLKRIADYRVPEDLPEINREFFVFSEAQGKLYERIICASAHNEISGKMIGDIINRTWNTSVSFRKLSKYEQSILLRFINDVGTNLYRQWVSDGKKIPLSRIITLSNELLCCGVNGFMNVTKE